MRGPYKLQCLDLLKDRGVPIGTVLDVGILTGTPELIEKFADKRHILFEPVIEFNEQIKVAYHGIEYELYNVGVAEASGTLNLKVARHIEVDQISHSALSDEAGEDTRAVQVVTIDDFLADKNYAEPYFFKIDVDGLELKILQGAIKTLASCAVIMVEADKAHLVERLKFVTENGFELFDIVEPAYYDSAFWQCDLIFLRKDLFAKHFAHLHDGLDISKYTVFRE